MSTSQWPDLPVGQFRVGTDGVGVVFADDPEVRWVVRCAMVQGRPRVTYLTVESAHPVATRSWPDEKNPDGKEHPATVVLLDEHVSRPPYAALAAIWARALDVDPDDSTAALKRRQSQAAKRALALAEVGADPDDNALGWDHNPLLEPVPAAEPLRRKPNPRPYGDGDGRTGEATQEYRAALYEWARPIAEVARQARAKGLSLNEAIRTAFPTSTGGKRSARSAEDLLRDARSAGHDLPSVRTP